MSMRVLILLSVLAITVLATLGAFICADAPLNPAPPVSFEVRQLTNKSGELAVIAVKNRGGCAVSLTSWGIELEGPQEYLGRTPWPAGTNLPSQAACIVSMYFPVPYWRPPEGRRWRVTCVGRRNSWSSRVRMQAAKLPRVGRLFKPPSDYSLASEWFPREPA
jgi:hypothetical protein